MSGFPHAVDPEPGDFGGGAGGRKGREEQSGLRVAEVMSQLVDDVGGLVRRDHVGRRTSWSTGRWDRTGTSWLRSGESDRRGGREGHGRPQEPVGLR